jgi:hypothetical protein
VKLTGEWQRWQRLYEMRQGTGSSEAWNHPNRATGGRGAQRRVLGRRSGHRRGDTVKGALGAFFIAEAAHSTLGMKGKSMGGGGGLVACACGTATEESKGVRHPIVARAR